MLIIGCRRALGESRPDMGRIFLCIVSVVWAVIVFCKCECCGRPRQSKHGSGRWCYGCARRFPQVSSQVYHNQHGSFRVDRKWSDPLALTARCAHVTNLGASIENGVWTDFLNAFLAWRGVGSLSMLEELGDWLFRCLVACVTSYDFWT